MNKILGDDVDPRAVEKLIERYVRRLELDPNVPVHSLRVTALTTARERGSDIIDSQDIPGHVGPRTTLSYIRARDRLSQSSAYVLNILMIYCFTPWTYSFVRSNCWSIINLFNV